MQAIHAGFWKVDYTPTSVSLAVVPYLAGDYDDSLMVEQGDLDLVLLNWGRDAASPPNGWFVDPPSGRIDQAELDRVLLNWGDVLLDPSRPIVTAVPEPATIGLLLPFLLLAFCRHQSSAMLRMATPRRG